MRFLIFSAIFLSGSALSAASADLISFEKLRGEYVGSDALLLDRDGQPMQRLRVDPKCRRLDWVPLAQISPTVIDAVLRAEDKRFYSHRGVDWRAVASSAWHGAKSGKMRGASTISMQLVSLLEPSLRARRGKRSWSQKVHQIQNANTLESFWTKPQILEAYLNKVSFRGELEGIGAASWGMFAKEPHALGSEEASVLASLIRSPQAKPDRVMKRACALLGDPKRCDGLGALVAQALSGSRSVFFRDPLAPHVAGRLLSAESGWVKTTLGIDLQKYALETLDQQLSLLGTRNVRDGAVLVADNETGEILAYVGNSGASSSFPYVDGVRAKRQAGSTLKPFLYGLALEQKLLTPASLLNDAPLEVPHESGAYRPENYDNQFHGLVTVRTALAASLNIPAVNTLLLVGAQTWIDKLKRIGFSDLGSGERYGPSLALGSADVSLWELVEAYRTFANGGKHSGLTLELGAEGSAPERVYSESSAFLVSDILSDRESRSLTFGLENPLATRFWTAVKTGTSKDMRDNWCVGYSKRYTVGVWVGNFSGEPMWNVSGMTGAAPVWISVMNFLHQGTKNSAPIAPSSVAQQKVMLPGGVIRKEWFIVGTEMKRVEAALSQATARIDSPSPDSILATDPDIPVENQRVEFEASGATRDLHWVLNQRKLGPANAPVSWLPLPGNHTLQLVNQAGVSVVSTHFSVRGAFIGKATSFLAR